MPHFCLLRASLARSKLFSQNPQLHIQFTYSVQRTVLQSAADAQAAENTKKKGPGGGLDSVLSTIKGPKLVSTVAKSSMDWDVYKEKEGLEEDLQAAAKDG